jgi:hypothetical protein
MIDYLHINFRTRVTWQVNTDLLFSNLKAVIKLAFSSSVDLTFPCRSANI